MVSALSPSEYRKFTLQQKIAVSPNTTLFRFTLPAAAKRLGLPVGSHCLLRFEDEDGKLLSRAYTPGAFATTVSCVRRSHLASVSCAVTSDDTKGHFDLIIKVRLLLERRGRPRSDVACCASQIYEKGKMGQYLKKLPEGEKVEVKGPQGELRYNGLGKFSIHRKSAETNAKYTQNATVKRLGMVAGGSGITPMLQIIRDVVRNPEDKTEMSLIFANVAESVSSRLSHSRSLASLL